MLSHLRRSKKCLEAPTADVKEEDREPGDFGDPKLGQKDTQKRAVKESYPPGNKHHIPPMGKGKSSTQKCLFVGDMLYVPGSKLPLFPY